MRGKSRRRDEASNAATTVVAVTASIAGEPNSQGGRELIRGSGVGTSVTNDHDPFTRSVKILDGLHFGWNEDRWSLRRNEP